MFKGVCYHEQNKKWVVQIATNTGQIHIGYFVYEKDAARAYHEKAMELFGEDAS